MSARRSIVSGRMRVSSSLSSPRIAKRMRGARVTSGSGGTRGTIVLSLPRPPRRAWAFRASSVAASAAIERLRASSSLAISAAILKSSRARRSASRSAAVLAARRSHFKASTSSPLSHIVAAAESAQCTSSESASFAMGNERDRPSRPCFVAARVPGRESAWGLRAIVSETEGGFVAAERPVGGHRWRAPRLTLSFS